MVTPWGVSQTKDKLMDKIYHVTTASHGGIMIGKNKLKELTPHSFVLVKFAGIEQGNFVCFEEDCAVFALYYFVPQLKPEKVSKEHIDLIVNKYFSELTKVTR